MGNFLYDKIMHFKSTAKMKTGSIASDKPNIHFG